MTVSGSITGTANLVITNDKSSSGFATVSAIANTGTVTVTQPSTVTTVQQAALNYTGTGTTSYSQSITGFVVATVSGAGTHPTTRTILKGRLQETGATAGTVTLGDTSGAYDAEYQSQGSSVAVVVQAGNSGRAIVSATGGNYAPSTITLNKSVYIATRDGLGGTFSGTVSGTGTVFVDAITATGGSIYFNGASITSTGPFTVLNTGATTANYYVTLESENVLTSSVTNFSMTMGTNGRLYVPENQAFTGNLTISSGEMFVRAATAIGADSVGKTITVANTGSLSFTSSSASLTVSYLNATTFLNGAGAASSLLGSTGGALQFIPSSSTTLNYSGKIVLQSASTIGSGFGSGTAFVSADTTVNNAGFLLTMFTALPLDFSGVISGAGGLTKSNTSTLYLRGNSSYTGVTTLSAGTISVPTLTAASTNGPLGAATGLAANIVFSGASTLEYTGADVTWARNLTINAAITGTISVASGTTLTWTGTNTTTTGTLNKTGLGTLKLPTSLLHTGGTIAAAGTLDLTAAASIGSTATRLTWNGGTVANSSGSTITLTNPVTFAAPTVGYSGPNDLVLSANPAILSTSKTFDISAGKLTVSGIINDSTATYGLTKTGAGTLSLTNSANTYTGATTISGGVLEISTLAYAGAASSIGNSSNAAANLVFAGGTFKLTPSPSGNITDRSFTLTGNTTLDNGGGMYLEGTSNVVSGTPTLTLTGSSFGRIIYTWATATPAVSYVKEGTGTWVVNSSSHTGSTTVNNGLIVLSAQTPTLVVNGGGFSVTNGITSLGTNITVNGSFRNEPWDNNATLTYSGTVTLTVSPTITVSTSYAAYTATFSGVISGSGFGFTKAGVSTLSLTNTGNTFDGAITVNQGYLTGAAGTLGPSSATSGITVNTGGSLTLSDLSNTAFASRDLTLTGTGVAGEGALRLSQTTTGTQTFNSISLGGNATIQLETAASTAVALNTTASSISLGSNTLTLKTDSAPSLTIASAISGTGGNLILGLGTTTLSSLTNSYTGSTTIPSTATLTLSGLLGSGTYAGNINNDGTLVLANTSPQTLSGLISGVGGLTQSNGSYSYITGTANTYTGKTTLIGSLYVKTLAYLSSPSSLGAPTTSGNGQIDINNSTLYYDGTTTSSTDRNIYLSGATTLGGTLSVTNSGSVTYNGTVTMADVGAKTLTLTSAVGVSGTGTLNGVLSNAATAANTLSLTKSGTAKWTLGGNSTFTGAITHSAGPLELTHDNALGLTAKTYTQTNNAQLILTGGRTLASTVTHSLRGTITTDGSTYLSPIEVGSGTATIAGSVGTSANTIILPSDSLTITGQITAANEIYFGAVSGKTTTVSGGSSAVAVAWGSYGPSGTVTFAGSHLRTGTFYVRNGGTTRLNVASAAPVIPTSVTVSLGGTGTAGFFRPAHANGTLVWDNVGATAATTVTHATVTSNNTVQTLKIVRTAAFDTRVTITTGTFSSGVVIFDNSALGTLSSTNGILVSSTVSGGVQAGGYIYDNTGAFMAAYRHASGYMTFPVYGTTSGFVSQGASSSGFTTNNSSYNLSAAVTGIGTTGATSVSSLRLANSSASISVGTGAYLAASSIIDAAGASAARTPISGGIVRAQSTVTHIYTDNTNAVSGMTVSSKLYPTLGTNSSSGTLLKFGAGLLTTTETVKYASSISFLQGDWNAAGVRTNGTLNLANVRSTDPTTTLKLQADSRIGSLQGGNSRVNLVLDGANLTLTEVATTSGLNLTRTGSTERVIKGINIAATQTFVGSWNGVPLTMNMGTMVFSLSDGAVVAGAPSIDFNGHSAVQFNHASFFNTATAIGAVTVNNGSARIFSVTSSANSSYVTSPAQTLTLASVTRAAGSYAALDLSSTFSNLYGQRLSITAQADGVIGLWATTLAGRSFALYRTSGTFSSGQPVTVPAVDYPTYGTDSAYGFLASIGTGSTVGSVTASDHIQVIGNITAQTTVSTKSIKLSGASVVLTMADSSAVLTTEALLVGESGSQGIVGGKIQSGNTVTGELFIHTGNNPLTISSVFQDGVVPTVLVRGYTGSTLNLTGTSTHTGGTVLNGGGALTITADANLGAANCPLFFHGGSLTTTASISMTRNVTVGAGNAIVAPNSSTTLTFGGTITGAGSIVHNGSGTVVLSGASNDFQGGVRIASSGNLTLQHNNALGTGEIDFNFSGVVVLDTGVTSAFDPSSRISDRINVGYRFANSCGYPVTFASPFGTGNSTFIKLGTDDIVLAADNTYGGALTVGTGAVVLTHKGAIGTSSGSHVVSSGAALVLRNFSETMDLAYALIYKTFALAGNGTATYPGALWCDSTTTAMTFNQIVSPALACTIGSSSSFLFSLTQNAVAGTAGITYRADGSGGIRSTQVHGGSGRTITKTGVYTLELAPTASNTYTGLTTVSAGTLKATTETPATLSPIGTGGCTVSAGARLQTSTGTLQQGKLTIAGTLTVNSGVLRIGG
jgi:autotransporter-associated beta strand protein